MLEQKMQEYEEILEIREAELDLNWANLEVYFNKEISVWTTKVCNVSERCRNDIASGNEGDSTPIVADALLSVIGNIDMRFTIAIEILKGAAQAMKSEDCNNLASFNDKWQKNLEKQTIHFVQFKGYLYAQYNILDPNSELKNMNQDNVEVIITSYLKKRLCDNETMSRMYTDAWLASTKDKDTGYWGANDNDAGYIVIVMTYIYPTIFLTDLDKVFTHGTWEYKAYIDDVEKPAGTKQRLVNQFNGGTKLVDLPYKVVVEIQQGTKHMKCRFQKTPEGVWSTEVGPPQLINTWKEKVQDTLTLNDLSAE